MAEPRDSHGGPPSLSDRANRALWHRLGRLLRMPLPKEAAGPFRGPPAWCLERSEPYGSNPECVAYWGRAGRLP